MKLFVFTVVAALTVLSAPLLVLAGQDQPSTGGLALVVGPIWGPSIDDIVRMTQSTIVYPERAPLGAFVILDTPDSRAALFKAGAWFVLDGELILELR